MGSFLNRLGNACIGQIIRMGADVPIPPDTIERRCPSNGRPRGGFSDNKKVKPPCPAVPRRGPEAGKHHNQNFSNLSNPHETAMDLHFSLWSQHQRLSGGRRSEAVPE